MIDHLLVKLVLLSLSCQMYFDSSVLLESFLWVNVDLSYQITTPTTTTTNYVTADLNKIALSTKNA